MTQDEKPARKKGGRPRLYPGTEKRPTLTFRVRARMHEQLSEAAEKSQRSLSEEIERRLESSFENQDLIDAASAAATKSATEAALTVVRMTFGGDEYYRAARAIASAIQLAMNSRGVEGQSLRAIANDEEARSYLKNFIGIVLDHEIDKGFPINPTMQEEAEIVSAALKTASKGK